MKTFILSFAFALMTIIVSGQNCTPFFYYQDNGGWVNFYGYVDSMNTPIDSVSSWSWTFAGGTPSTSTSQHPGVSFMTSGTYYVCLSITTYGGCSGSFCDSVIIDNCNLNVTIQQTQPTQGACDGSIIATVSGGTTPYTYYWNTGQTTNQISNLCPGTYTLNVTDAGGCSESATATLFTPGQNCTPFFYSQSSGGVSYFYGYVDSVNTPIDSVNSWTWTFQGGGASYTSALQNPVMQLAPNMTYMVCLSITTYGGCSGSYCDTVYLGTPCTLVVTTASTQPTTGQCDGTITAVASGGTPPYSYIWNTGAATSTITNLCGGMYYLTVYDAGGCVVSANAYLNDSTNTGCNAFFFYYENSNGTIQFIDSSYASSGIVAWNWVIYDNLQNIVFTSTDQNPLVPVSNITGYINVILTITSANGISCTYTQMVYIQGTSPCTFTALMDITPVSVIGGNDGAIDLSVTGGIPPYSFLWNTGQTTEDITGLFSGNYTVMVFDSDSACPGLSFTAFIYEPYDTTGGNIIIDTLTSSILDTCLNFVPDTSYISQIDIINNTTVVVTWVFEYQGQTQTIEVSYTFGANGNYIVTLTINCGSKTLTTYSSFIHIDAVLGIADIVSDENISIFPNPASSFFNIDATPPYNYTITNISGQIVYSSSSEIGQSTVNSSDLPAGIYFVMITNNDSASTSKIVISR